MAGRIQLRRGTAAQWTAANPVLAAGEPGIERDTGRQKIGDGATAWNALPYVDAVGVATRIPNAALSADGQILTRASGTPTGITRAALAADLATNTAFSSRMLAVC